MSPPSDEEPTGLHCFETKQTLRWRALIMVPVVIAFGLGCKLYKGPGFDLINNFGPASVAYVVLMMLILFAVIPKPRGIIPIGIAAFLLTCGIELSQSWQPTWLAQLRETLPGRLILGTTFDVLDFPAYVVGAIVGVFLLKAISRRPGISA